MCQATISFPATDSAAGFQSPGENDSPSGNTRAPASQFSDTPHPTSEETLAGPHHHKRSAPVDHPGSLHDSALQHTRSAMVVARKRDCHKTHASVNSKL